MPNFGGPWLPYFVPGALLLMQFARRAAKYFPNVEIIECSIMTKNDALRVKQPKTAELWWQRFESPFSKAQQMRKIILLVLGADFDGMRISTQFVCQVW